MAAAVADRNSLALLALAALVVGCGVNDSGLPRPDASRDAAAGEVHPRPRDAPAADLIPPDVSSLPDTADPDLPPALPDAGIDAAPDAPPDVAADAGVDAAADAPLDVPPPVELRVNVNGPAYDGLDYPGHWAADPGVGGVCGPMAYRNDAPIAGTRDDVLFQGEMFGSPLVCAVGQGTLPPGMYQVNLYFAEIFWGPGCPGKGAGPGWRVFDIAIEGKTVRTSYDIFAEAGCAASAGGHPVVERFTVPILDGTLDLRFEARMDNAKISAIEVISAR